MCTFSTRRGSSRPSTAPRSSTTCSSSPTRGTCPAACRTGSTWRGESPRFSTETFFGQFYFYRTTRSDENVSAENFFAHTNFRPNIFSARKRNQPKCFLSDKFSGRESFRPDFLLAGAMHEQQVLAIDFNCVGKLMASGIVGLYISAKSVDAPTCRRVDCVDVASRRRRVQ